MIITKKMVGTPLSKLDDTFTLGVLVDAICEASSDVRIEKRIFFHPKVMPSDGLMTLAVVELEDEDLILSYDDHILAIENNIRRMISETIMLNEDEINKGEMEYLFQSIDTHLHQDDLMYDGLPIDRAVETIIASDMFTSLSIDLRRNWDKMTLQDISDFYKNSRFKKDNKDNLDLAESKYRETGIYSFIEVLGSILDWEDEENDEDEE